MGAANRWALPAATGPTFALVSDKEKGKSFSPSGKEKGAPTRPGLPVGPGERTAHIPQRIMTGVRKKRQNFMAVANGGMVAHRSTQGDVDWNVPNYAFQYLYYFQHSLKAPRMARRHRIHPCGALR